MNAYWISLVVLLGSLVTGAAFQKAPCACCGDACACAVCACDANGCACDVTGVCDCACCAESGCCGASVSKTAAKCEGGKCSVAKGESACCAK
jgi:hypothetical protein